jgi:hypothetical protein
MLSPGTGVLRLTNVSEKEFVGFAKVWNNDSKQSYYWILKLPAKATTEIGINEGWAFEPNETILISGDGYVDGYLYTYKAESGSVGIKEAWYAPW